MGMELKQSLKLTQQLVMTPQLQQAIKLLQLSRMELLEQVREEMEQNPLLEQPEEQAPGDVSDKEPGEASLEAANMEVHQDRDATPVGDSTPEFKGDSDNPPEIDWEAYLNSYQFNEQSTASNRGNVATEDMPSFEANMVKKEDLVDHLQEQMGMLRLNEAERRVAMLIIGNLDDDGYLKLPDVEGDPLIRLTNEADVPMSVAERTLRRIQALEPKGCGARDLQECLLIQVQCLKDRHAPLLGMMIKRYMKYLESKNLPAIAKELKVPMEDVVAAAKLLPKLDPKPGRNFSGDDAPYITPDVFIYKMGEEYTVVLNDDGLSKLRISGAYRNALKNGAVSPGQAKEFIQDKLRSAQWLIRSIHQRQRTIFKVTESIVKFQRDFLDKGIAHLRPLILRDVAEDIGMHESTVSRVTTSKYVHTPQGIFELKYFFNSSIARVSGDDTASEAVKHHIKQLVSQENPREPYSDQKIVELLKAQGTEIARRTVAKYREVLGILPSSKRKRYF
ncbi:RNA polymerase, sigma 54 subunit, RpoN/SigL [Stigmatella aurantiaca]|uniref:RNA polymerase, sigma 54 subunit, RpoN/SigL n=1 Tax=Stigmatella aurantiaca TaxID=41 RepID=A0A1H8E136_STIAU|nr:RNA polymerase, sigma 54 subunit, RpoN/SigL [Stigmatella aurantiaca]